MAIVKRVSGLFHWFTDYLLSWLYPRCQWGWLSYVRKTGKYEREKEPLFKKIKLTLLFNPLTEWIDTTHLMRLHIHNESMDQGKKEGSPESKKEISKFVQDYEIDMSEYEPSDINKFRNFEDFFTRKHKPGSRPIDSPDDESKVVCVADSRVVAYETVAESKKLWIKGRDFTMANLLMDTELAKEFAGGPVASFRLSPQDYHRYHSPVTGKIKTFRSIPGDYYEVDPIALQSDVDILTRNKRQFVIIETKHFGDVLFCAIGATDVGSVVIHEQYREPGTEIKKGDELGIFQFGGSSIIVGFHKGAIDFDEDIVYHSKQRIQVAVEVGMSLGKATSSGSSSSAAPSAAGEKSFAEVVQDGET